MNEMRYGVPFSHITLALQFIMLVESAFILSMLGWYGQLNGSSAYGVIYIISFFSPLGTRAQEILLCLLAQVSDKIWIQITASY